MDGVVLDRLNKAYAAFVDVVELGIGATMTSEFQAGPPMWRPDFRSGEFDVVLQTPSTGIYHEQIAAVHAIAEKRGGHLWIGPPDGRVSILFEISRLPGPDSEIEEASDSPRPKGKKRPKGKAIA
jgi:hypothetical protein